MTTLERRNSFKYNHSMEDQKEFIAQEREDRALKYIFILASICSIIVLLGEYGVI